MTLGRLASAIFQVGTFALPWFIRRWLLGFVYRFEIDANARIGLSFIFAKHLVMHEQSRIGHFNFISNVDSVELHVDSGIGTLNYITGFPGTAKGHFDHISDRSCHLVLKRGAGLTSRHFIDCTCGVTIEDFTTVAGIGSLLLTHSIDVRLSRQHGAPIVIGRGCFIGSKVVILPGIAIADRSVITAGTVVYQSITEGDAIYGSHQLRLVKRLDPKHFAYADRSTSNVR